MDYQADGVLYLPEEARFSHLLTLGLINEDGVLYRAIRCEDMAELNRVGDALQAHGLASEVAQGSYAQRGFM
jgi:hypothetical protein